MTADVAAIEAHAFRAWPAEYAVDLDGWTFRSSAGLPARRINSATTPVAGVAEVAGVEPMIRAWFEARDTQPVVRVLSTSDPKIDRYLATAGWERESPTLTLSRDLDGAERSRRVRIDDAPSAGWIESKQRLARMSDATIATWLRRAGAIRGATGYASISLSGVPVAIGLGVVADGWVGLFDLNTDPGFRRRGLARAVVQDLERWAMEHAATGAYLQVEEANEPALKLYRSEGYIELYRYWYRRAPEDSGEAGQFSLCGRLASVTGVTASFEMMLM